ncbi:MAG: transposase, partial [bacterium]|nr:transposase [bacterium]
MRHVNGLYTQYYNRRYKADGQLFRGRYKSILVDADSYLLELVKYIHRNHVREGLVDKVDTYAWCSHKGYLSDTRKWSWLYKDSIFSMLSNNKQKQKKAYRDLMRENESASILQFFTKSQLPAILGPEEFIDRIRKKFYKQRCDSFIPQSRILAVPIATIKKLVAKEYKTALETLTASRRGTFNEPRSVAIFLSRQYSGKTLLEIGEEFNMQQFSSVSSVVTKIKKLVAQDIKLKKRVLGIEKKLAKVQT